MRTVSFVMVCLAVWLAQGCQQSTVSGPAGQKMTVAVAHSVTLHRGQSSAVEVGIQRVGFTDPVTISVSQLPAGVTVEDATRSVGTDKTAFIFRASPDADLVGNQQVRITAQGPAGVESTQYMSLTIVK